MAIYNVGGDVLSYVYDSDGSSANKAYNINGEIVYNKSSSGLDYSVYTTTDLYTYVRNSFDGLDVYNGVIAQFTASNSYFLFDLDDCSVLANNISSTSGHGDSVTFTNVFYDSNDEFPLVYVTADTSPAVIYLNRITRTGSTLIQTLTFPISAGYYGAGAFDFDNNICYLLAYKEENYRTDDGGANTTVVSKWDLSNLTDNGDGTYTPTFISQYERAFIYVMQGLQFFDGYVWVASGWTNGGSQYVYAMNPSNGIIEHTITLDDTIEIEGLAWVYDESQQKWWMLIGQQNGVNGINYSRIDFAPLT